MDYPLISVIIPIYNVEKYVRKCLDSLRNQTMKKIEVLCIDDGSTDCSGKIADEYESRVFPIFRVFHTENRGLSAARNRGLDEAQDEWLMFVDSDDWVDRDFCKVPYEVAVRENAEMVIFQNYDVSEQGRIIGKRLRRLKLGLVDHQTAIDVGGSAAWRRLYRKKLFESIRYPEGHVHEDIAITHKLVYRAFRIVSLEKNLYFYRHRSGSICHAQDSEKDRLEMSKLK